MELESKLKALVERAEGLLCQPLPYEHVQDHLDHAVKAANMALRAYRASELLRQADAWDSVGDRNAKDGWGEDVDWDNAKKCRAQAAALLEEP